ncbi:fatty acid desaturase [Rhizobium sp. SSA_523]|uniref:fatty acid desaturase n=1 Tax=Rhizobium sp. SSA_523 TaxID=2952477 RepID=UPI002091B73B|nr:fatty acid desaturase [Rhizobium sp. SSA_523]MCO5734749.1 fatty acid desaturase [Rhizobium sp. SSA_523]WKC22988.1 fatty acid desaturase [Rhizobium sp. SSA_523]
MASWSSEPRSGLDPTVTGLFLAGVIILAWLSVHVTAIFVIDWSNPRWLLAAPFLIALQCWLSVGLFIIAHDTMHGSLAPSYPRLSRAIGRFCVFIYAGFSYDKLYDNHHAHHRHAGTDDDPDFDADHPSSFWPWYLKFFRHYFGWREFGILTIAVVIYLVILRERFPTMLAFWALPAILSSLQLFYFGTYRPHRIDETAFIDRHRARSNDLSPFLSLLTCFHFGYHHEHHDAPQVPWWNLPAHRRLALRIKEQ